MLLADLGTSYCKFLDTSAASDPWLVPTHELDKSLRVDLATGHNGRRHAVSYVNELTALARGGEALIERDAWTLLDCGSRDIKIYSLRERRGQRDGLEHRVRRLHGLHH